MYNTSIEAYKAVAPKLPTLRSRVLEAVRNSGVNGITAAEIYRALPDAGYVLHQRLSELKKSGDIVEYGLRKNVNGYIQKVWIAPAQ